MRSLQLQYPVTLAAVLAAATPILPSATVKVVDPRSIYNGYTGFVQRISDDRAAVLFEGGTGTSY